MSTTITTPGTKIRKSNASRVIDGMIRRLKNGAHIRYDGIGWTLVDGNYRYLLSPDQFDDLFYRGRISHTHDHTLYASGCIWLYRKTVEVTV